ncbi:hypothetical protein B0H12DRAFT_1245020 [Mycena haematopus]|nr:hypothetical protein B0H12DRAFT_1245020 [Mycena haematopus]
MIFVSLPLKFQSLFASTLRLDCLVRNDARATRRPVIKKHHDSSPSSATNGTTTGASGKTVLGTLSGGDGSLMTTGTGETLVYKTPWGLLDAGLQDLQNPFVDGAKPNLSTPALNESWTWGVDRIYGVILGGWFVLEPQSSPTLPSLKRADGTLTSTMQAHYDAFITEHIAAIAGSGLNWMRLTIPFWAISTWTNVGVDETGPRRGAVFGGATSSASSTGRKYGLRVNLDPHTAPGSENGACLLSLVFVPLFFRSRSRHRSSPPSPVPMPIIPRLPLTPPSLAFYSLRGTYSQSLPQPGYNHSGKLGQINFLNGPMGFANAQRMLDYIRVVVEFMAQLQYANLVPLFGIVNEGGWVFHARTHTGERRGGQESEGAGLSVV